MKIKYKILCVLIFFAAGPSMAQTCGFGCLGLSGAFGGYAIQSYETEGLNNYLNTRPGFDGSDMKFGDAKGFRIGGNIVRAKFDGYFLTLKGFYQFLSEEKEAQSASVRNVTDTYSLEACYWGIAVDVGIPANDFIDIKLMDGGVSLLQTDFEERQTSQNSEISYTKYENDGSDLGYFIGSGLIVHLVSDYVTLEGTAYYSVMNVSNLIDDSGNKLLEEGSADAISKGGFSFIVQLNIGFPL